MKWEKMHQKRQRNDIPLDTPRLARVGSLQRDGQTDDLSFHCMYGPFRFEWNAVKKGSWEFKGILAMTTPPGVLASFEGLLIIIVPF